MKELFQKYQSINNDNNSRTIDFYREQGFAIPEIKWYATEKAHGTSFSAISDGDDIIYCQRSHVIGGEAQFMGHLNWVDQIEEKVKALAKRLGKIQVFFEYYGKGIVNKAAIPYRNDDEKSFIAYDILLLEDNKFLEYPTNFEWFDKLQIAHTKVMAEGTFDELLVFNTDFKSPLAALSGIDTHAEGIVLKPWADIRLNTGERVILKRISERFAENRPKAAQKQELTLDEGQVQEIADANTDVRLGKVAAKFGILPDEKQKFAQLIQELALDIKEDLPEIELNFIKKQIPGKVKGYFGM